MTAYEASLAAPRPHSQARPGWTLLAFAFQLQTEFAGVATVSPCKISRRGGQLGFQRITASPGNTFARAVTMYLLVCCRCPSFGNYYFARNRFLKASSLIFSGRIPTERFPDDTCHLTCNLLLPDRAGIAGWWMAAVAVSSFSSADAAADESRRRHDDWSGLSASAAAGDRTAQRPGLDVGITSSRRFMHAFSAEVRARPSSRRGDVARSRLRPPA
jgi:hypothetical protein